MEEIFTQFNFFKKQSHDHNDIVKAEDLKAQIQRLRQLQFQRSQQLLPSDHKNIQKYIRIYSLALAQLEKLKLQFTKPSIVNERLADIFDNQKQQLSKNYTINILQKSKDSNTGQVQLPSFKKAKQNVIDAEQSLRNSPGLRRFFEKKQEQIMNKTGSSNFRSIIKAEEGKSFQKSFNRSVSRQQPSRISRTSTSSAFKKKPNPEQQLRKVLEENRKIKEQYEQKIKRQLQLSEFEKNLLKEEKNRYMLKIEELEAQLENMYRNNYRLRQEEALLKERQRRSRVNTSSFQNVDEDIVGPNNGKDYYQPYIMKTKHNDLRRLNQKCSSQIDPAEHTQRQKIENNFFNKNQLFEGSEPQPQEQCGRKFSEQPIVDVLGNQLQQQIKAMEEERSRSNKSNITSKSSSKKWSREYNPHLYQNNNKEKIDIFKKFQEEQQWQHQQMQKKKKNTSQKKNLDYNKINNAFSNYGKSHKEEGNFILQDLDLEQNKTSTKRKSPFQSHFSQNQNVGEISSRYYADKQPQIGYRPKQGYSFSQNLQQMGDYEINATGNSFDTFAMTRSHLDFQGDDLQDSTVNKYIDSKTSTRNKVAFFKDSLIIIKNQKFQLAFKRSSLVPTKDRVRIIFFIRNKTQQRLQINFNYQYDAGYFKLRVNEKMQQVAPFSQAREDLEIYAFSDKDLNQVIDILLEVNGQKYALWMPILWIQFFQNDNFKMPHYNQEISIIPDRQFKNYETAKTMMPLMYGGYQATTQWAYLFGMSKFGPCHVKLSWQNKQLRIQSNAKWIDLLAFVMHHVK